MSTVMVATTTAATASPSPWTTLVIFDMVKVVHLLEFRLVRVTLTGRHSALSAPLAIVAVLAAGGCLAVAVSVVVIGTAMLWARNRGLEEETEWRVN